MPDVDNKVPLFFDEGRVQSVGDLPVRSVFGDFLHILGGRRADMGIAVAPVVFQDTLLRNRSEHPLVLLGRVGHVLSEGRDDVDFRSRRKDLVEFFGNLTGAAVRARNVGREQQDALRIAADPFSGFFRGFARRFEDLIEG